MLEFGLRLGDFGFSVDEVAEKQGVFGGADHEGGGAFALDGDGGDFGDVGELRDDAVVGFNGVFSDHLQDQGLLRGDVFGGTDSTDVGDDLLDGGEFFNLPFVCIEGRLDGLRTCHDAFAIAALRDVLPEFFRDEGHEGVEEMEEVVEEGKRCLVGGGINGLAVGGLDEFEEPCRKFIPEEVVDFHQGIAQAIF